jgi:serine/threonine protein kinase
MHVPKFQFVRFGSVLFSARESCMANKTPKVYETAFDTYTVVRQVGSGGSGTVCLVTASDGQSLALKLLDRSMPRQKLKRFQNEIQFCLRPGSEHIVHVLDYGQAPDGSLFYVMPYYPSTLRDLIKKRLPQNELIPLYGQILDSMEAAHLLGVYHRDIKPENLLYDSGANRIVLADFGIARFREEQLLTTVDTGPNERLANFAYAAPEQRIPGQTVDQRADIYALGLILNEIFTGQIPQGTRFRQIKDVAPDFAYLDELVELMARQQPEQRPQSVRTVKEELIGRGHQFIQLQRLEALKKQVVPESEVNDPLISDPIHAIEKEDYRNGVLILKLNRAVNQKWEQCFKLRASAFTVNVSSAMMSFRGDTVSIRVNDHFAPQAVEFFRQYCVAANEEYAAQVKREHHQEIERRRAELRRQVAEEEARRRILEKIQI